MPGSSSSSDSSRSGANTLRRRFIRQKLFAIRNTHARTRAYHGVTLATKTPEVAREALKTAEADLKRAQTVRDAGLATEADVLAVQVHVAAMKEQVIRREADLQVALAAGLPAPVRGRAALAVAR